MAEKLTEAGWNAFTKKLKLDLDDGALVKALSRFDKSDESKPEPRRAALDDVIEQIKKQVLALARKKKELGDKVFGEVKDKLNALLDAAETQQKQAQAAASDSEEEADTPALLTTKMVPLLRELRKGEARMSALICTAGKNTAVLIMRRAISPARRKLLAEAVDATGGMKYVAAEVVFENKTLTFIVQAKAAQLAKRLRQALLDQTQLRFKVKVRSEDGEEEVDGEDEDDAGTQAPAAAPSAAQLAYEQRLRQVEGPLAEALRTQHAESTKLRGVIGFASEKAAAGDYAAALKALDMIDKLLGGAAQSPPTVDPLAAFNARLAALVPRLKDATAAGGEQAQEIKLKVSEAGALARGKRIDEAHALLDALEAQLERVVAPSSTPSGGDTAAQVRAAVQAWQQANEAVDAQIAKLQQALKATDDSELHEISEFGMNGITGNTKARLMASLFELGAAQGPALRAAAAKALPLATGMQRHLESEPRVAACDENPFGVTVSIRKTLGGALTQLAQALQGATRAEP